MKLPTLAVCVCLAGTTFAQAADDADRLSNVHTVAIVSALGDDVALQNVGDFRWDTPPESAYRTDWKIDDYVTRLVSDALKDRFTIVPSPIDGKMLAGVSPTATETTWDRMRDRIAAVPAPPGLDAYIVISPWQLEFMGYHWTGLGLFHSVGMFGRGGTQAYAQYRVSVLDAKTGERIDYGEARHPAPGTYDGHMLPLEICSNDIWADSPDKFSDSQKQQIRDEMTALVTKSLPYALEGAHLIAPVGNSADISQWQGRPLPCHSE